MENSTEIDRVEEDLEKEVIDWLGINNLGRLSKYLISLGASNMDDIIFISKNGTLLNLLKLNAKIIDYYKFVDATAPFVNGAKQCSPSTFTEESDEVLADAVKITKKRDATTALFSGTAITRVNESTEFIAQDENIAQKSFLPYLYPPFVSYNENNNFAIISSSSSSSVCVPKDSKCARDVNIFAKDRGDKTSPSHNLYSSYNKMIKTTPIAADYSATTISTDTNNTSANSNTTTITTTSSLSNENLDTERQAFLEKFPINRCSHVFKTRREMDEVLEGITWDTIYHEYGWGFTSNASGLVDLMMIRDDCKGVKRRDLKKYGVENVHYFNVISGGGPKSKYEKPVVDYFKNTCIFLDP